MAPPAVPRRGTSEGAAGPSSPHGPLPADVEALLADAPPAVAVTARWVVDVAREALPGVRLVAWPGWRGVGLRDPAAGVVGGVFPRRHDVRLYLEHGRQLPDPAGVLVPVGTRGAAVDVAGVGDPPEEAVVAVLDAALALARERRSSPRPGAAVVRRSRA